MRRLVLVLLACVGCGGGSSSVPIDDLPADFEASVCEWAVRCKQFADLTTCKTLTFLSPAREIAGAKAGRSRYDGAQAGRCIAAVDALDCQGASFVNILQGDVCREVFVGLVAQNGPCAVTEDCVDGAACGNRMAGCDPELTCCLGTCGPAIPDLPLGSPCQLGQRCAGESFCQLTSASSGVCTQPSTTVGAPCDGDFACGRPLRCLNDSTGTRACRQPVASGGTCDAMIRNQCALIYEDCDPADNKCKPAPGLGQPCTRSCLGQASCEGGVCMARAGAGQPCGSVGCAGDLDCEGGTCVAPAAPVVCP